MPFVYHGVPRDMTGDVLYPLNGLAAINPDLYEFQRSKYVGREAALKFRIPGLNLLLGDTIHCAALHPNRLFQARQAVGIENHSGSPASWATGMFYAIPLERIEHHRAIWYSAATLWINSAPGETVPNAAPADEFDTFDRRHYRELSDVPVAHVAYLRRMKELGRRPLMFVHIPHILVAGQIDVTGLAPLAWDQPPTTEPADPN